METRNDSKAAERKQSTYQKLRAAGLCVICHVPAPLRADGTPAGRCVGCAEERREVWRLRYERWRRNALCGGCGKPLTTAQGATATLCPKCAAKNNRNSAASVQRTRDRETGVPNSPPLMLGPRIPKLEGGRGITAVLDGHAVKAFEELKRRDDARFEKLNLPWQDRTFRASRIVRAAIRRFETVPVLPPPFGRREGMRVYPVKFYLDGATFATLERLTAAGFRSRSACLRAVLRHAARPEAVTARRRAGALPYWDEERRRWED